ncbi:MAG: hypothetical protein CSB55_07890 [Candidatus Cloacimonadota bacterium]|nr:MAG: hypothetical protein CSB55_07890 [Candidatus Cloacimonadota bacterium]
MKQIPQEEKIMKKLEAGVLTADGFLGNDQRSFFEIIESDKAELEKFDKTSREAGERLRYFYDSSVYAYDGPIIVDENYEIENQTVRGFLLCPFSHPGRYPKGELRIKNLKLNKEIKVTPLNIHLIEEHGFFEGKGSSHRLEIKDLMEVIF